jgi:hypothetical protein
MLTTFPEGREHEEMNMLRKVILTAVVALSAAGMTAMDVAQAFPVPAPPQTQPVATTNDGLQLAAYYRHRRVYHHGRVYRHGHAYRHRRVVYSARVYGPRYRYRRAGYGYYYGGYWYARPWWTVGVAAPVVVYNARLYGPRYRYHRAGYGFYHGGYYYRRRWW